MLSTAQSQEPPGSKPTPSPNGTNTAATLEGQRVFNSSCASCHGLDGHGSERAPDIATRREVQRLSEDELFGIVDSGRPGGGMPSFRSIGNSGIHAVVSYLRILQGKFQHDTLPGNAEGGKKLFFGKAGCSRCHMVKGEGGFIGSDLTAYGASESVDDVRDAITKPAKNLGPHDRHVVILTREGRTFTGVARNEDNFSLQLQTLDGAFHLFMKKELAKVEYPSESLMPSDYSSRLSRQELDDIVSYLISVAATKEAEEGASSAVERNKENDR